MKERIKPPISVYDNATVDDLRIIFSQAKDRLTEQSGDAERLYQRGAILITVYITALTSIIGYIGSHLEFNFINLLLGTIGAALWIATTILKDNLIPQAFMGIGSEPISLMTTPFFTELEGKTAEWHILYSECISFQQRIDNNRSINDQRADNIRESIKWLYWIPFLSITIILLSLIVGII